MPFIPFFTAPPPCDIDLRTLLQILFTPPLLLGPLLLGPGSFEFAAENGVPTAAYDAGCCCRSCVRPRTRLGFSIWDAEGSLRGGLRLSIASCWGKAWTWRRSRGRVEE